MTIHLLHLLALSANSPPAPFPSNAAVLPGADASTGGHRRCGVLALYMVFQIPFEGDLLSAITIAGCQQRHEMTLPMQACRRLLVPCRVGAGARSLSAAPTESPATSPAPHANITNDVLLPGIAVVSFMAAVASIVRMDESNTHDLPVGRYNTRRAKPASGSIPFDELVARR